MTKLRCWPSIVELAADYAAAIRAATSDETWRAPLRTKYADLLLALMGRQRAYTPTFAGLADRFERVISAEPEPPPSQTGGDAAGEGGCCGGWT